MTDTLHTEPDEDWAPIDLTFVEAVALLKRSVAENGAQTVYAKPGGICLYFTPDGCPSCLIGHVLHYKGMTYKALDDRGSNDQTDVSGLIQDTVIRVDMRTEALLALAQGFQDDGVPWGRAVEQALEGVAERVRAMQETIEIHKALTWDGPI